MKNWLWLLVTILTLLAGCAQGYYDRTTADQGTPYMTWQQNPETEGEYIKRIWSEESNR